MLLLYSIDDLFIRKNIKFTFINLIHEMIKLYIPYNDCECNLILKVCSIFVNIRLYHEIKLHNRIIFYKK